LDQTAKALQWLLLTTLHDFLPQLTLVLHTFQLRPESHNAMQLKGLPRWKVKRECLKMRGIPSDQLVHLLNINRIASLASSDPNVPENGIQLLINLAKPLATWYLWKVF
jgi:hypothetical protein